MFEKNINVQFYYQQIFQLVNNQNKSGSNKQLKKYAAMINKFIFGFIKKYGSIISTEKMQSLKTIYQLFNDLRVNPSKDIISKIDLEFEKYAKTCVKYIIRHPEKYDAKKIPNPEKNRDLSYNGVSQARDFAKLLIYESLLVNKNVYIYIEYSTWPRTEKFGKIIEQQLYSGKKIKKNIDFSLNYNWLIDGKRIINAPYGGLDSWFGTEEAVNASKFIKEWFNNKPNNNLRDKFIIFIGITHMPNMAAFYLNELKINPGKAQQINHTEFVRKEGSEYINSSR